MVLSCTTVSNDGKSIITQSLTGINISLSRNGSFIQVDWSDENNHSKFRILEKELREFLDCDNQKHGTQRDVYGEYWKTIK